MQEIILGNNIEVLKNYPDNYFDSIVTDPPYGLGKEPDANELMKDWIEKGYHEVGGSGFMGKEWDAFVPQPIFWKEVFRVLKHGGHVVAFYGTRTYDWGVMAMRFAGFEVRDCIQWLYGSGFPKSHNISKAIDKMYGAEREVIGEKRTPDGKLYSSRVPNAINKYQGGFNTYSDLIFNINITAPSTDQAKKWDGWGSALKPAHEDLVLARKPFQFSSDFVYLYENIVYNLKLQICQSKLFAKDVKEIFLLSQKELQRGELDFAQWSVGKPFNTMEDLLVLMDMLQLELKEGNTTLNIVLLWLNTLVELWNVANTYTTETESSTITELRILNSLEWESIFQNITLLKDNKTNGLIANVLTVESLFSVLNLKLNDILTHSAKENVTLKESEKTFVPNSEQIVLARKPLEKGLSIAENVLKWGTGGINIDGCRVGTNGGTERGEQGLRMKDEKNGFRENGIINHINQGRFPANLILTHHPECECVGTKKVKSHNPDNKNDNVGFNPNGDNLYGKGNGFTNNVGYAENGEEIIEDWKCHDDCPIKILDEQSGILNQQGLCKTDDKSGWQNNYVGGGGVNSVKRKLYLDKGGASRFFYVAKASKSERNKGLEGFEEKEKPDNYIMPKLTCSECGSKRVDSSNTLVCGCNGKTHYEEQNSTESKNNLAGGNKNFHPTVKPIKLMQYLVRLITPLNGIVLDPFCGSGTTGIAAKIEGFNFIGIEMDEEYHKIAKARIENYTIQDEDSKQLKLF